jgi:hypothetical protein
MNRKHWWTENLQVKNNYSEEKNVPMLLFPPQIQRGLPCVKPCGQKLVTNHLRQACKGRLCSGVCWTWVGLGVSRQDIRRRIRCWLVNQHWVWWRGLGDTQRQARELISGPRLGAKARFLFFNRTQSRAVTGLLTGHNTLRRHLHLMGCQTVHCVGDVEQRMKRLPTFFLSAKL